MTRGSLRVQLDRDIDVEMRDGVALATDVYRIGDDPRPVLLQRVPYGKNNPAIANGALDVLRAVGHGYAVVVQDCRGRGASDGTFDPFTHEAEDGAATVDWIVMQPWCTGAVGTFGRSYSAMTQWLLAARGHPHLKAIAPMFSGHDVARGWMAPGGVLEWGFLVYWAGRYLAADRVPLDLWDGDGFDGVDAKVCDALADALPSLRAYLEPDPVDVGVGGPTEPPEVPALIVAGWFDVFARGCFESYAALVRRGTPAALIAGPWPHGGTNPGVFPELGFGSAASADAVDVTGAHLAWFDYWLRGHGAGLEAARVFTMGRNGWSSPAEWPPSGASARTFYLASGGRLASTPGAEARTELTYNEADPVPTVGGETFLPGLEVAANAGPRDQRRVLERPDVAVFVSDPLAESILIHGSMTARLSVESERGVRFCVRLLDVAPDGAHWLISEAAAYASDAGVVEIALGPTSYEFAVNHRIGVAVTNGSYPRFGRFVSRASGRSARDGTTFIVHGPRDPSCISFAAYEAGE